MLLNDSFNLFIQFPIEILLGLVDIITILVLPSPLFGSVDTFVRRLASEGVLKNQCGWRAKVSSTISCSQIASLFAFLPFTTLYPSNCFDLDCVFYHDFPERYIGGRPCLRNVGFSINTVVL